MLQTLKTHRLTCDNCGYNQEWQTWSNSFEKPNGWIRAFSVENKCTRLEETKYDLCPTCSDNLESGALKKFYA